MSKIQAVFKRVEKKYMVEKDTFPILMERLLEHMNVDQYGIHTICNIYYDTDQYDLIRASLEKPVYKEKFRVRSYGVPNASDNVFLEIKKKYKGVVYKRRMVMDLEASKKFLREGVPPEEESQIQNEIQYFMKYYEPEPKVFIAYDRMALFGKEDKELRITFDTNIRSRDYDLELESGDHGELLLERGEHLMEIKIAGAMPLWLSSLLTELSIYPASFSKYGNVYKKKIRQEQKEE